MGAWFCSPCLYGRAVQRLDMFPSNDATRLNTCNSDCWLWTLASCCLWMPCLPMMFRREQLRERFGIPGDLFKDCIVSFPRPIFQMRLGLTLLRQISYCCTPCAIAQMNTEMKKRAEQAHLNPQQMGYQPQTQRMVYQAPQEKHTPQVNPQPTAPQHPALQQPLYQQPIHQH